MLYGRKYTLLGWKGDWFYGTGIQTNYEGDWWMILRFGHTMWEFKLWSRRGK